MMNSGVLAEKRRNQMTKTQKEELMNMDSEQCIAILEELLPEQMDVELIGILARAYNNHGEEAKAKKLLLQVQVEGENDGVWNYRIGYSCFYLYQYKEALAYLERAKELGCGEWADELLPDCRTWLLEESLMQGNNTKGIKILCENEFGCVFQHDDRLSLCFDIDKEIPRCIGQRMNEIHQEAYMNGYNWEAFFNFYLSQSAPEILNGMETDSEAGMYVACYDFSDENKKKTVKFFALIQSLLNNENIIYDTLKEHGNKIEWD